MLLYQDLADRINAVHVKYTVGYGTASSDVPDGIKQAVLLTIRKLVRKQTNSYNRKNSN